LLSVGALEHGMIKQIAAPPQSRSMSAYAREADSWRTVADTRWEGLNARARQVGLDLLGARSAGTELTGAANPLRGPDASATRGMGVRPP